MSESNNTQVETCPQSSGVPSQATGRAITTPLIPAGWLEDNPANEQPAPINPAIRAEVLKVLEKNPIYAIEAIRHRIADLLATCPSAHTGVHKWMWNTALAIHNLCPDKSELEQLLTIGCSQCGREVSDREIHDAVTRSQPGTFSGPKHPRWAKKKNKPQKIKTIPKDGFDLDRLISISPIRWDDNQSHVEEVIDALFPGNPLLCGARRAERSLTRPREEWRGFLVNQQFIVPNPMSKTHGRTQGGRHSMRCLDNVGPRRFLVIEFDPLGYKQLPEEQRDQYGSEEQYRRAKKDEQAALLMSLSKRMPLAMVVDSAGKSLHGWFYVAGQPEQKITQFFSHACSLGADAQLWTPCQYVRMPDGTRDTGQRQRVVYFNPEIVRQINAN